MKKIGFMLLAASVLIFSGCTKTGPPGPQGPQGPAGYDGNANVVGSDPFTVSSWSLDGNIYYADFTSPDITADIANYGSVSIFKYYPDLGWTNLPDINGITSTVYNFYSGGFSLYVQNSDGTIPAFPAVANYRIVVIESSLREANPDTDWTDYKQVMDVLENAKHNTADAAAM